jgi:hypothetical protein
MRAAAETLFVINLKASWQSPYGVLTAVDFPYGRFGIAFSESTP